MYTTINCTADLSPSCSSLSPKGSAFSGVLMHPELGPTELYNHASLLSSRLVSCWKYQTRATANIVDIYNRALEGHKLLNCICLLSWTHLKCDQWDSINDKTLAQRIRFLCTVRHQITLPSGIFFFELPRSWYHHSPHSLLTASTGTCSGLESQGSGVTEQWESLLDGSVSIEYNNSCLKTLKVIFYRRYSSFCVFLIVNK